MPNAQVSTLTTSRRSSTQGSSDSGTGHAVSRTSRRIVALDFTKGALVLIMVLYHWLNYFVIGHDGIYKFLRFLPTSFTFITGFLISQVYLAKYEQGGLQVSKRLLLRGVKLLGIAAFLNLAPAMTRTNALHTRADGWSIDTFVWAYFAGTHSVAFSVLVPIAYLLILSAGLLFISRHYRNIFHIICFVLVGSAIVCDFSGVNSGYLQIISVGMLGVSVGHIPIDRINTFMKRPVTIFTMYCAYLIAITLWNDSYILQVAGVIASVAVFYWIGMQDADVLGIQRTTVLLGQYSLFAYIAQILILQLLRGSFHAFRVGKWGPPTAFFLCLACAIVSVEALDRSRSRLLAVNKLYNAVFC